MDLYYVAEDKATLAVQLERGQGLSRVPQASSEAPRHGRVRGCQAAADSRAALRMRRAQAQGISASSWAIGQPFTSLARMSAR
jgi:hypothetical protein